MDEETHQELAQMRGLLNRMKGRHNKEDSQKSRLTQLQCSQQITEPDQGRSRAISHTGGGLKEIDENVGLKFLDYKKGRQLPYWLKND